MATKVQFSGSLELAYASPVLLEEKGADQESIVRYNHKKILSRSQNDEAGKLGSDGRNRRAHGSSDDEGKITDDGFSNEDLRAGGPYICSLPATTSRDPPAQLLSALKTSSGESLDERIRSILYEMNIEVCSGYQAGSRIWLALRQSKYNPEPEPIPTIFIISCRQTVDDTWLRATRQIHSLLRQENLGHVSVEIIDVAVATPVKTSPVLKTDAIFGKWDAVLRDILRAISFKDICTVGCYRRGRSSIPTVLVLVEADSEPRSWKPTRDSIVQILNRMNLPMVAVEIVKDKIRLLGGGKGFNPELLNKQARPGGPIASLKRDDMSGTLGGFIEIRNPILNKWECFALTCFHVVDPRNQDVDDQDLPGKFC